MSACDSLTIITDSDETKLIMYQYSANILFDTPSGYIKDNLDCDPNNAYVLLTDEDYDTFTSLMNSAAEITGNLPCQDIVFNCVETESCSIRYINKSHDYVIFEDFQPYFNCHGPIYFDQLFEIQCIGTCPLSPTQTPTTASLINEPTSTSPTTDPTNSPSAAPTVSPTDYPTQSPTNAPSAAPTNNPIASNDFDSFIIITFVLDKLRTDDKTTIATNAYTEMANFEMVLNDEYFVPNLLLYENYLVRVMDIEGTEIQDININTGRQWENSNLQRLRFETKIECNLNAQDISCDSIKKISQPDDPNNFAENVQAIMRNYTDNNNLLFYVEDAGALTIECKFCEDPDPDYVFYGLTGFLALLVLISIFAFMFNLGKFPKLPGFNYVDNAAWSSLIAFGLQCWYGSPLIYIHITNMSYTGISILISFLHLR